MAEYNFVREQSHYKPGKASEPEHVHCPIHLLDGIYRFNGDTCLCFQG